MKCRLVFIVAGATALATGAVAQQPQQPRPVTRATVSAQLDAAFATNDANHDGSLSMAEIQVVTARETQQARNVWRARLQAQFKQLDTNKDGQLSFQEYSALMAGAPALPTAQQVLQKLDTNHDGKLSPAEFKVTRLGQFDKVDLNHDGTVTPDEERRANGQK